jgi:glucosamine 6-phosphate synthetase-like amidotransferase/phosphosugar isomerase protein
MVGEIKMCGIAFVVNYSDKKLNLNLIENLFKNIQARGTDASGIYYERIEDRIRKSVLVKAPVLATTLWNMLCQDVKNENYKQYVLNGEEKLILLHARAKTQGTEYNNKNNMPITSKNYVLIHNGIILSYKKVKDYQYQGEVDSEEILANIETYGITKGLENINGSISCVIRPKKENFIYVYRNTNPLALSYWKDKKILIGASLASNIPFPEEYHLLTKALFQTKTSLLAPSVNMLYKINIITPGIEAIAKIESKKEEIMTYKDSHYINGDYPYAESD